MDRKIIKNYLYSTVVQAITLIVPFITIPYISRILTAEEMGLFHYTLNVMTYFSLAAELGFQFYGQKVIVNSKDEKEERENFLKILYLKLIFGSAILLIYILIVVIFLENKLLYFCQAFSILGVIFDITWYFAGKEDFKRVAIRGLFFKLASVVLLFTIVRGEYALIKYILSLQIPNFIGNLLMYYKLNIKFTKVHFEFQDVKATMISAFVLLIPSMLTSLYQIIDKAMLGNLSSMTEVGYYSQMLKLTGIFSIVVYSIGKVIFPRLIAHYHKNEISEVQKLMSEIVSFVVHLGFPICVGVYCILDLFVPWFYGDKYLILIDYFPYALPLIIVSSLNHIFSSQLLIAINKEKLLYLLISINIIINISLDFLLIPHFDAIGAIIASVISESIQFICSVVVYKKYVGGKILEANNAKVLVACLGMAALLLLLKQTLQFGAIVETIITVIVGAGSYFIILKLLKDSVAEKIVNIAFRKIKNRG